MTINATDGEKCLGSATLILDEPSDSLCLAILNGRGFFGVFREIGNPILVVDGLELVRDLSFSYVGYQPSQVTKLCMGDFIGNEHRNVVSETDWEQSVRDFL
jgi:hypothetical protein